MQADNYLQIRLEIRDLVDQAAGNLIEEIFEHEVAFSNSVGTTRFSTDFSDGSPRVNALHEMGLDVPFEFAKMSFGELTWEGAEDSRRDMPTGQTARMHKFRFRIWNGIPDAETKPARMARLGLESTAIKVLDQMQYHYRLNQQNGIRSQVIDKIEPGTVGEVYATEDETGSYYYITEVSFQVQERVSYRLDRTSSL